MIWSAVDKAIFAMSAQLAVGGFPDVVVGILRGGMVPAVMMSHHLRVRDVRAVGAARTIGDGPNAPKHDQPVITETAGLGDLSGLDVVLVDDVGGSGATIRAVTDVIAAMGPSRLRRAVLAVNTQNWVASGAGDKCEYFDAIGTSHDGWVHFPWESSEQRQW